MPNSGDTDGSDPLGRVSGSGSIGASQAVEAAESPSVEAAEALDAASAAAGPDSPQAIAQALASGDIDGPTAQARLIEAAVRARMPPDASPQAISAVRAEVEALVGSDPILEQLLRP